MCGTIKSLPRISNRNVTSASSRARKHSPREGGFDSRVCLRHAASVACLALWCSNAVAQMPSDGDRHRDTARSHLAGMRTSPIDAVFQLGLTDLVDPATSEIDIWPPPCPPEPGARRGSRPRSHGVRRNRPRRPALHRPRPPCPAPPGSALPGVPRSAGSCAYRSAAPRCAAGCPRR